MNLNLNTLVGSIKGIGPQKESCLKKLNINKVEDLLFYFPRKYLNLKNIKKIGTLKENEIATVKGRVLAREEKRSKSGIDHLKIAVSDGTGILYVIFFNQIYLKNVFQIGKNFIFHGKVEIFNKEIEMINPFYEEFENKKFDWILPVYPLTKGITQKYMRKIIKTVLKNLNEFPEEILPLQRRLKLGLSNIKHALLNIHFPLSETNLEKARNYLIFREFFIFQLNLLWRKRIEQKTDEEFSICEINENLVDEFEKKLPFKLTENQKEIMSDIIKDIKSGKLIRRLIYGEVGSGKTTVAIFTLWIFCKSGYQGVFLCPTEILAQQHYINWNEFFLNQGISVSLLTGSLNEKEKFQLKKEIKNGKIKVVIGTHSILNEKVEFKDLKIVIVDEQHKFGVRQQEILKEKSKNLHYITMSATPIPRTVALALFGNMDFSILGELPKGKRQVITYLFSNKNKEKIYSFIKFQIIQDKIGLIVTPAIKENEDIESAEKKYKEMCEKLPEFEIGLLHGKLPKEIQEETLRKFRSKEIKLLVSTTVIETGIDIPNISFIIIEQAERFGLAQLHQLRGRVGRSGETGYCFLVVYNEDEETNKKLASFVESESGFDVAELDFNLRGPGDLFGTRQHGILPLKIGDIKKDIELLNLARKEVERILYFDPELKKLSYLRKFIK
ncbi:MAG: ATP-dependent DNA helicase RecG [Candidatus Omnitrophica bacterium]|nr:ATP-dependent DNA helicase RecG [Candidatus Omnitrophota bacterium]MCM8807594.1 ATP-dependent DNA helicase RecG [Candidatus Omnitrophota bacterium]